MDLKRIKAFAFDIDGVATDGSILCNPEGDLLRIYDAKDGFALRMAVMHGYPVAVITGGRSESIRKRMITSGLNADDIFLYCRDKREEFGIFCERYGLKPEDVMFFGDDIPDVALLEIAGCGVCPADAVPEAKAAADWISSRPGGKGCLREGIETTLREQGNWTFDTQVYKQKF